ncbi:MAG: dTMP kinase [Chlamydiae bacterium]|nr:dTMP kinase [Chlamydiota bacterium]
MNNTSKKNTGFFITFEGGDGAGKTTLIDSLYQIFSSKGREVVKTREPGGTLLGEMIRNMVLNPPNHGLSPRAELFLFLADRAEHVDRVVLPALKEGKIVLSDRFTDSTLAYQGVGRGLKEEVIKSFCAFAADNLQPDLTIYLDIDPKIGMKRIKKGSQKLDRIETEGVSFHEKIRAAFLKLAEENKKRIRVIDATKPPQEVLKDALRVIDELQ